MQKMRRAAAEVRAGDMGKPRSAPGTADMGEKLSGELVTEHIWRCPDGVYRWYYELPMMKNPTVLYTVWAVLGISFGLVFLFVLIVSAIGGSIGGWTGFLKMIGGFLLLALGFVVISLAAYAIVARAYGGSYVVLFEMDEKLVRHIQVPRQFKQAQALAWLTVLAGIASGQPTLAGAGLLVSSKNSSTSVFANVERIVVRPRRDLIKVNQLFERNQVYAAPEDYEFVREHIVSRCTKARVR